MSDMEYWAGTLKPLDVPKGSFEQQVNFIKSLGYILDELDIEEEYFYQRNSNVALIKDKWYEAELRTLDTYELQDLEILEDGSIKFMAGFYNGGTHIGEVLEHLVEEANNERD